MPFTAARTFTDPDAYFAAIRDTHAEGVITGRGNFRAESTVVRLDRVSLQRSVETLPRTTYTAIDPKVFVIAFVTHPAQQAYVNGLEFTQGDVIVYRAGSIAHTRTSTSCQWGSIALTHEDVATAGETIIGRELAAPSFNQRIRPSAPLFSRLQSLHEATGHLAKTTPDILAKPEVARAIEESLVEATVLCVTQGHLDNARNVHRNHATIMRRLEEVLTSTPDGPLYMPQLCRMVGASYTTLYDCCQEYLGMSPKRYLWLRRMHLVRRDLWRADAEKTTVTEIATGYGFWELGRFAVAYRSLFGEPPSTALRRPPEDRKPGEIIEPVWKFVRSA
jgi:AraC-like DNA-binding protein